MICLKRMSEETFEVFKKDSQIGFAKNLASSEDISFEEALKHADQQFQRLVSKGIETQGQLFFDVFENQKNQPIGYLWLGLQERFGKKVASVNDIKIEVGYRGKGYGKALMKLVDDEARSARATRVRLHVFNHNEVAKQLYLSMGFIQTSLDMKKDL